MSLWVDSRAFLSAPGAFCFEVAVAWRVKPKTAAVVIEQAVGNKIRNLLKRAENEPVGGV